jgi:hypothetical protein
MDHFAGLGVSVKETSVMSETRYSEPRLDETCFTERCASGGG